MFPFVNWISSIFFSFTLLIALFAWFYNKNLLSHSLETQQLELVIVMLTDLNQNGGRLPHPQAVMSLKTFKLLCLAHQWEVKGQLSTAFYFNRTILLRNINVIPVKWLKYLRVWLIVEVDSDKTCNQCSVIFFTCSPVLGKFACASTSFFFFLFFLFSVSMLN